MLAAVNARGDGVMLRCLLAKRRARCAGRRTEACGASEPRGGDRAAAGPGPRTGVRARAGGEHGRGRPLSRRGVAGRRLPPRLPDLADQLVLGASGGDRPRRRAPRRRPAGRPGRAARQRGRGPRRAAALADRQGATDPRTVNRELSALRSAVGWWQDQEWISGTPPPGCATRPAAAPVPAADRRPGRGLFRARGRAARARVLACRLRLRRARRRRARAGRGPVDLAGAARRRRRRVTVTAGFAGATAPARCSGWLLAGGGAARCS